MDWKQKFDDVKSLYEQIAGEKKAVERELGHLRRREPMVQMLWAEIMFLRKALNKAIKMGLRVVMDVPNTRIEDEQRGQEMREISSLAVLQATSGKGSWMTSFDEEREAYLSSHADMRWEPSQSVSSPSQADAMGVEQWLPSESWGPRASRATISKGRPQHHHGMSMSMPYSPLDVKKTTGATPVPPSSPYPGGDVGPRPPEGEPPTTTQPAPPGAVPPDGIPPGPVPPGSPPSGPTPTTTTPSPAPPEATPPPESPTASPPGLLDLTTGGEVTAPASPKAAVPASPKAAAVPALDESAPPAPALDDGAPMAPPMDGDGPPMAPPMDGDGPPMAPSMDDGVPLPPGVGMGYTGGSAGIKPTKKVIKPNSKMKPLHWKRVLVGAAPNPKAANSIWNQVNSINEKVEKEMDFKELEKLFSKAPEKEKPKTGKGGGDKGQAAEPEKKEKIVLLDGKRHNQLAIMLSQMPPYEEIAKAILNLDASKINRDQLESLYKAVPTTEEINIVVKGTQGVPKENILAPERFVLAMAQVPQLAARVDCWRFSLSFDETFEEISKPLDEMLKACKTITASKDWQRLMSVILCVGNYLNGSTKMGQADGFQLEILTKLPRVKDSTGSLSLLDYIVQLCNKQFGKGFCDKLKKEFEPVKAAQALSLKSLSSEGRKLMGNARLNQKMHSLVTGSSQIKDDKFDKVMGKFNTQALKRVNDLATKVKEVHQTFVQTLFYHEPDMPQDDAEQFSTEEFFTLIYGFVSHIQYTAASLQAKEEAAVKKQKQEEAMKLLKEKGKKPPEKGSLNSNPTTPLKRPESPGSPLEPDSPTTPQGKVLTSMNVSSPFGTKTALMRASSPGPGERQRAFSSGPAPYTPSLLQRVGSIGSGIGSAPSSPTIPEGRPTSGSFEQQQPSSPSASGKASPSSPTGTFTSLFARATSGSVTAAPTTTTTAPSSPTSPSSPTATSTPTSTTTVPSSPTATSNPPRAASPGPGDPLKIKKKRILWQTHKDEQGNTYYYNLKNGESTWVKPPNFPY